VNHAILGHLQDVFNLLPNLGTSPVSTTGGVKEKGNPASDQHSELARAMSIKTNDQLMTIYISSLIRAITAFHDLIENKIQNRQQQEEKDAGSGSDKEKEKDGEKKEGEEKKDEDGKSNGVNGENKKDTGGKTSGKKGS
jgi:26S proteasome regulatory subunit N8